MGEPMKHLLFLMVLLIGAISAFDNMVSVVTMDTLAESELNPVASAIIDSHGVSGLVVAKAIGTLLAVAIMLRLVYSKYRAVIIPVFMAQCYLFVWINFSTPHYGIQFSNPNPAYSDGFSIITSVFNN